MCIRDRLNADSDAVWTPSKLIDRLGKEINDESSVLYWAHKNKIPIFCPALTDGSIGDMLFFHTFKASPQQLRLDIVADIRKINSMSMAASHAGMIILGGGLIKHHICNACLMRNGADLAVYINTGQEFDGSDAGARPDEAVSWGKIKACLLYTSSFTKEGPLSQVPILSSEVYMTHIIRNENLFLDDLSHFAADQEQDQEQEQVQEQVPEEEQEQEEDVEPESDIPSTYNSDGSMEKYEYTNNHNNNTFLSSSMDSTPYQSDIDDVGAFKDCKLQQDTLRNRLLCLQMNFSTFTDGPNEKWLPDY